VSSNFDAAIQKTIAVFIDDEREIHYRRQCWVYFPHPRYRFAIRNIELTKIVDVTVAARVTKGKEKLKRQMKERKRQILFT